MTGLEELNRILKNSKIIKQKENAKNEAEYKFIKDFLKGFEGIKKNETTNNKK